MIDETLEPQRHETCSSETSGGQIALWLSVLLIGISMYVVISAGERRCSITVR